MKEKMTTAIILASMAAIIMGIGMIVLILSSLGMKSAQAAGTQHYCAYQVSRVTCHPQDNMCEIVFNDGSSRTIEGGQQ